MLADAFAKRFNFGFRPTFLSAHRWVTATPAEPAERVLPVGRGAEDRRRG